MKIQDYEIFKFSNNSYKKIENNGCEYYLNDHVYLDIVLTDFCNANCNFCIGDLIHDKLSCDIDIFKQKIQYAVNNLNVDEVLLLGGEPTVSKHLLPLISWLTKIDLKKIIITTNGIRLAQDEMFRKQLFSSGLTNINISFMSIDNNEQKSVTNSKYVLSLNDLKNIYEDAKENNVSVRINNNIYMNNNDTLEKIILFYDSVKLYCDSVKFSPILPVDDFSVINVKTEWCKQNLLSDNYLEELFNSIQNYYIERYEVSVIENDLQFGFVKNSMIPLKKPIILNWNFGNYTGMMKRVVNNKQINNIKLLSNNELSLSWNREMTKYFLSTQNVVMETTK